MKDQKARVDIRDLQRKLDNQGIQWCPGCKHMTMMYLTTDGWNCLTCGKIFTTQLVEVKKKEFIGGGVRSGADRRV